MTTRPWCLATRPSPPLGSVVITDRSKRTLIHPSVDYLAVYDPITQKYNYQFFDGSDGGNLKQYGSDFLDPYYPQSYCDIQNAGHVTYDTDWGFNKTEACSTFLCSTDLGSYG